MPKLKSDQEVVGDDAVALVNRTRQFVRDLEDFPRRHGLEARRPGMLGKLVGALLEDMRQDLEDNIFVCGPILGRDGKTMHRGIFEAIWLLDQAMTVGELKHTCYALIAKAQVFAMSNTQTENRRFMDYSHYDQPKEET